MTDPEDDSPFPEPVAIPITDSIDLHYFRAAEIGDVVDAYLEAALEAGFREVRLIHGRGKGVQRSRVQQLSAHLDPSLRGWTSQFRHARADRR